MVKVGRIDVVGLGPAGPGLVTAATLALIDEVEIRRLRTARHPAAAAVQAPSFDHHYEAHDTFDAVYRAIVADLAALAHEHGRVLYAVPGSPAVAEHTVELMVAGAAGSDLEVVVHPALSFADLSWVALGVDPIADGVRIVDAHRFADQAAGDRGPVLITQCHDRQTLSDIKLAIDGADDITVTVLQRLGLADQAVFELRWHEIDRLVEPDHLTSLYVPELPAPVGVAFERFAAMTERLRAECPWDADQTHASLRRYLLEESYETLEALDGLAAAEAGVDHGLVEAAAGDLKEELGDLLYQIFFHSVLAAEQGWFDVADVATAIHDKLYERHPHVYGPKAGGATLAELPAQWEAAKLAEKDERTSVMDGIPAALPALLYATKVQKKAAAIGRAWAGPELGGDLSSVESEAELAELLFAMVARAQALGLDAESLLRERALAFADEVRSHEST